MSTRRTRRRRDSHRPTTILFGGLAVLLVLGLAAVVSMRSPNGLPLVDYRDVTVAVENPGNLQSHNDVRINGVRVGQVTGIDGTDTGRAVLTLRLNGDVDPLPVDSQVVLRGAGLLGARYVELKLGTSTRTLAAGDTLMTQGDVLTYGVPDVLNTFDARAQASTSTAIRELGATVLGRGQPFADATALAPRVAADLLRVFRAPLARPGAVERLVPAAAAAADGLADAAKDFTEALPEGRKTFEPIVDRKRELSEALNVAPGSLDQARRGLDEGTALIAAAGSLARAANRTLPVLPAGLRATTGLLRQSPRALRRTDALLVRLSDAVPSTVDAVAALDPLLTPITAVSGDLRPIVQRLAVRGCDLENFSENWRSMVANGPPRRGQSTPLPSGAIGELAFLRLSVLVSTESLQGASWPDVKHKADPYPEPCASSPGPVYPQMLAAP